MKAGIGLDLGSTGLRGAAVRSARGGKVLQACAHVPFSAGTDIQADEITAATKALVKDLRPAKGPLCLGLLDQRMVAREVELPWVPRKELKEALPMLASDLLPMSVEESVLDFLPSEELVDTDGTRTLRGLLVAADEESVTTIVEAVEAAGVRVDRVDFGPLATLHSVCDPMAPGAEAVLVIGATCTCLMVHEGNRPTFVRVMAKGGAGVTESLAEQFAIEVEQAEAWKCAIEGMWPTLSAEDQLRAQSCLDIAATALIEEIRSSVMFYRSTTGTQLDRVWLAGGGAAQMGLDLQLREALHLEVQRASGGQRLASQPADEQPGNGPEYSTAIGLAMGVSA